MKEDFALDQVLRELFVVDRPSLFNQLAGGIPVQEFLKAEFLKPQVLREKHLSPVG